MTIPLDNLYHYIDGLFPEPVCMYLFYPHGSRDILSLTGVKTFDRIEHDLDGVVLPLVICNDQEPLKYKFYQNHSEQVLSRYSHHRWQSNLRIAMPDNIHDKIIILHSEKNSNDLQSYIEDNFIGVYYWAHAFISRDWYRFAEIDHRLCHKNNQIKKDFLIYCREFDETREDRLKFQELLFQAGLTNHAITSIKKPKNLHNLLDKSTFINPDLAPISLEFLSELPDNSTESSISASYFPNDFLNTRISVVLETVFDGPKIHLTEKIFRPIACGHPFFLASAPGSLEYLRSYGFKTFSPWINEDYDFETDSLKRLKKIIDSMKSFNALSPQEKNKIHIQLKEIALYNKHWFFSDEFIGIVNHELINNINSAMSEVKKTRSLLFRLRTRRTSWSTESKKLIAQYIRELKKLNPP